ncbi:phosphotransferase enzyme family protein [Paenibacillus sp. Cedars]|uniref:phosphotransferase enzyme family protein n=1 Tax=Paenibacillus sp. Cedars TaxID=1980674 RepID=UPI001165A3EF|nr:phosphotransferase [Paenibacillus sp. Cedars]AWP28345.1 aminoglycoside phosphotransferase [Paenibacillus sp. Cedars]
MDDFFQFENEEQRGRLLARAEKVAMSALQSYNLQWVGIKFIGLSDTITYQIRTNLEETYLLRIHSDRWSRNEIESELQFLDVLIATGITVPTGVVASNGLRVMKIDTDRGFRSPYVTIMRWMDGEHVIDKLTEVQAFQVGAMIAGLHEAAIGFDWPSAFTRPTWGIDSYRTAVAKLERYAETFMSEVSWALYQRAAEKVLSELNAMTAHDGSYGLIHADLHLGNIVFAGQCPQPIDFGRCGFGYFLYDLAAVMLSLVPKQRYKVIEGYRSVRKLESDFIRTLECFFIMIMMENYSHHASNPRETDGLKGEQIYALAYIHAFLNGSSFLLNVVQPVD